MMEIKRCPRCGSRTINIVGKEFYDQERFFCHDCELEIPVIEFKKIKTSKLIQFVINEEDKYIQTDEYKSVQRAGHGCGTPTASARADNNEQSIIKYLYKHFKNRGWFSYKDILDFFNDKFDKELVESKLYEEHLFEYDYYSVLFERDLKNNKLKFLKRPLFADDQKKLRKKATELAEKEANNWKRTKWEKIMKDARCQKCNSKEILIEDTSRKRIILCKSCGHYIYSSYLEDELYEKLIEQWMH